MLLRLTSSLVLVATLGSVGTHVHSQQPLRSVPAPDEAADIVVNGRPIRCRPLPNDPLHLAALRAPADAAWVQLVQDAVTHEVAFISLSREALRKTHAGQWQRTGNAFRKFVFREPTDGSPMCVGIRKASGSVAVNWQQILNPVAYECQFLRFTAFVNGQQAEARFWMNSGKRQAIWPSLPRTSGWIPLKLEDGPVRPGTDWIGFGLTLTSGDMWMYKPEVGIVPHAELSEVARAQQEACLIKMRSNKADAERQQ